MMNLEMTQPLRGIFIWLFLCIVMGLVPDQSFFNRLFFGKGVFSSDDSHCLMFNHVSLSSSFWSAVMTASETITPDPKRTQWFADCKWGVFTHYLVDKDVTADAWNRQVDAFDVKGLADQLESLGVGYYFMTIGQNSGHWCAPNKAYDEVMGWKGSESLCSQRDLMLDIGEELTTRGIRLMAYHTCDAPMRSAEACERFDFTWGFTGSWPEAWNTERTGLRQASFQRKWEAVTREWSLQWGDKVHGWWLDGCYFADEMYRHDDEPNFASFIAALRAGNPDALVAFNPGVLTPVITHTPLEDYTAGEIDGKFPVCPGAFINQARYHILSYVGEHWGNPVVRFPDEFVLGYTKYVTGKGGVVTWDAAIQPSGLIADAPFQQLRAVAKGMGSI